MKQLPTFAQLADGVLEASIIGSFTKIGISIRERLHDFDEPAEDLTGQTAVVTGATSGIGNATAAGLMRLGADVHVTSRSKKRADAAAFELMETNGGGSAIGHELDTGEFESCIAFVNELGQVEGGIDILIHNAGALSDEYRTNGRGTELTLASHLVGPYLLTRDLRPYLNTGARVLWMSSGGMYTQKLDVKTIELSEEKFRGAIAYAKAKRGQVELVAHLAPDWAPDVIMHTVHPGWVDTAGVDAGLPGFGKVMGPLLRSAEQGADTMVWLAATGGGNVEPGQFWLDRQPRGTSYLPWTSTSDEERQRLVDWLELKTLPASAES
ncbi:MAG: dehydrogenase/reductase SDR family protein 12 [Acidimicrobiales bacterium]|jgi:dehydrogenase/reductase SDR family protein 12